MKGQIWIETVVYTLIGITIIGIVLGLARPEIQKRQDAAAISASIETLRVIDSTIEEIKYVGGNTRPTNIKIGRGKMVVDGENDKINIIIDDSSFEYSQPGLNISSGNIFGLTVPKGSKYLVTLSLNYTKKLNITYKGQDKEHVFQYSPSPYNIAIANNGLTNGLVNIDLS